MEMFRSFVVNDGVVRMGVRCCYVCTYVLRSPRVGACEATNSTSLCVLRSTAGQCGKEDIVLLIHEDFATQGWGTYYALNHGSSSYVCHDCFVADEPNASIFLFIP